ncbi:hypothetical protein V7150_09415 [Neobacillus drentensis]|uniref:S8 family serine peptidase n=1 Tax=Neobacillus drentensis TaxID=220684 RepID=UPI002FFFA70C
MANTDQRLIVGFYPNVTKEERKEVHKMMGSTLVQAIDQIHAEVVTVPAQNVGFYLTHILQARRYVMLKLIKLLMLTVVEELFLMIPNSIYNGVLKK